jgi:hypothetical protein
MGVLHGLQPGLSPLDEALSYYVHGAGGWLLTIGLLGLGLGSLALTVALWTRIGQGGRWCLAVWCMGAVMGGIFPTDPPGQWDKPPSVNGLIHGLSAMAALGIFPIAAVLASRSLRSCAIWCGTPRRLGVLGTVCAVTLALFLASLVPVFVRPGPPVLLGLTERILILAYVAWLAVAAIGVLRYDAAGAADSRASSEAGAECS